VDNAVSEDVKEWTYKLKMHILFVQLQRMGKVPPDLKNPVNMMRNTSMARGWGNNEFQGVTNQSFVTNKTNGVPSYLGHPKQGDGPGFGQLGGWSASSAPHDRSGERAQTDRGVAPITVTPSLLEKEKNVNSTGGNVGTDQVARMPGLQNWMYDATARELEVRKYFGFG
jgi:hypothetical protein